MMTRRNKVAMRESNDDIDHKEMLITGISFVDEVKCFLNSMPKRRWCSNIFNTRANFGPYFWP